MERGQIADGMEATTGQRRRAQLRLLLGFAQMASAAFTFALLLFAGTGAPTWIAFGVTTLLTAASLLIFRRKALGRLRG